MDFRNYILKAEIPEKRKKMLEHSIQITQYEYMQKIIKELEKIKEKKSCSQI